MPQPLLDRHSGTEKRQDSKPSPADSSLRERHDRLKNELRDLKGEQAHLLSFINMLVHELRAPLTSINGFSDYLAQNGSAQSPEKLHRYCQILQKESSRLSRMVDELLDLGRMRSGRIRLDSRPFRLETIITRCVESLQILAERKNISLAEALPPAVPSVVVDPDKIQQAFANLVINAIRYSPEGSEIRVGVTGHPTEVECWVKDNGIGINQENLTRIFEEFYRVEQSGGSSTKGSGLGLSITRTIVEMHGGRVRVESRPGRGSTFFFSLPVAPPPQDAP